METKRKKRKTYIKRDWAAVFEEYSRSDMTVLDFCRVQGIPQSVFYHWRKKFKDSSPPNNPSLWQNDFIRLSSTTSPGPPVSIVFGGKIEVCIHNDCDRVLLGDIIAQLKESSC